MKRICILLLILPTLYTLVFGFAAAAPSPVYDIQPQSQEDVLDAINAFNSLPPAQAVLSAKPHWQFEVSAGLMPAGWRCELVDWDESFGAPYYTFFSNPVMPDGPGTTHIFLGGSSEALTEMIRAAAPGDTILITSDMNFSSSPVLVEKDVTIQSSVDPANPATLTQANATTRHFQVVGGAHLTLGNVTLNGAGTGGGVEVMSNGTLTLNEGASILRCHTEMNGGGVYIDDGAGFVMNGGVITFSTAGANGGGIYIGGFAEITDGLVGGCTAKNGGGVFAAGPVTVTGGLFAENTAADGMGGGLYVAGRGSLTISGACILEKNAAPAGDGGGVYTEKIDYSNLDVDSTVVFRRNSASRSFAPPDDVPDQWLARIRTPKSGIVAYNFPVNNCDINSVVYIASFMVDGGTAVPRQILAYGNRAAKPIPPEKAGHDFVGWYKDDALTIPWDFTSDVITGDVAIYAKWASFNLNVSIPVKLIWTAFEDGGEVASPDYKIMNRSDFSIKVSGMLIESDSGSFGDVSLVSGTPGAKELRLDILGGDDFAGLDNDQSNPFSSNLSGLLFDGSVLHVGFLGGSATNTVSGAVYGTTGWFRIGGRYGGLVPATKLNPVFGMQFHFAGVFPPIVPSTVLPLQPPDDPSLGFMPHVTAPYNATNDFRSKIKGVVNLSDLAPGQEYIALLDTDDFPCAYWQLQHIIHPSINDYSGTTVSTDDPRFDGTLSIGPDRFGRPSIICSYIPSLAEYTEWFLTHEAGESLAYTITATLHQDGKSAELTLTNQYYDSVMIFG